MMHLFDHDAANEIAGLGIESLVKAFRINRSVEILNLNGE